MTDPTHLSLFSGIGGLDLAAEAAGFRTVGQCEWADYPTRVLEKHWPDVPRWRDIRTLTKESFYERTGLHTVGLISGGFPCQPFSVAGKRKGKADDRYLWPEMLRVIQELRPAWVVGENVAGIVNMELDQVLSDLEGAGYAVQAFVIPACAVDAPHRRDRIAIVANTNGNGCKWVGEQPEERCNANKIHSFEPKGCFISDSNSEGLQKLGHEPGQQEIFQGNRIAVCSRWPAEPDVGRVAHGVPNRVDRLRCLGNAVVPAQFAPIFRAIAEIGSVE